MRAGGRVGNIWEVNVTYLGTVEGRMSLFSSTVMSRRDRTLSNVGLSGS